MKSDSTSTEDDNLYRCLKTMEATAQSMTFQLPFEGSEALKAMQIEPWKIGALASLLSDFTKATQKAATAVYMRGKE